MSANPFTPTFGKVPEQLVGRDSLLNDLIGALDNGPGDPNLSTIITGARGTGKTAVLNYLAHEAGAHGWISASVSAGDGMLEDIIQRTAESADAFLSDTQRRLTSIGVGSLFSLEWENKDGMVPNWRTRMNRILDQMAVHDIGLLITVDKIKPTYSEVPQLASIYQHFVGEDRKVALVMAGLPHDASLLLANPDVSFLRRSAQHHLGNVSTAEARVAIRRTVEGAGRRIDREALKYAAEQSGGYPYLIQLVGFRAWAMSPDEETIALEDARDGVDLAYAEFERRVLQATYRDLSDVDIRFLEAMTVDDGPSVVAEVAQRMGVTSSYTSKYKSRLLEQGAIEEVGRGRVAFALPGLKDFVRKMTC